MKSVKISTFIIIFIPILIAFFICAILFSNYTEKKENKELSTYFSRVSYAINGKMSAYRQLGGRVYLIEINVDSSFISEEKLTFKDHFIGLYSKKDKKAYLIAFFECDNLYTHKEIRNDTLPYVKINSSKRTIEYYNRNNAQDEEELQFFELYKDNLEMIETEDMIRF